MPTRSFDICCWLSAICYLSHPGRRCTSDEKPSTNSKTSKGPTMPAPFTTRPVYMGTHGVIAAGHYLAARAGQRMFDKGGNAIDAAVASGFALNVLEPQSNGIGGEVPILVHSAKEKKPFAISGQGFAPQAATVDWFRKAGVTIVPGDGFLPATVPVAFSFWTFDL